MSAFTFLGLHAAAVSATLSGDGKEKLKTWRDKSSFSGNVNVWLADVPEGRVILSLPDAVIDDPANWAGAVFTGTGKLLLVRVEAPAADNCYAALQKILFSRFAGQPERGCASFPVWAAQEAALNHGVTQVFASTVRVHQIDTDPSTRYYRNVGSDAVELEYLTVSVSAAQGAKENWGEVK